MESLIDFRQASDSLNDEEYQICIKEFLKQCSTTFDRDAVSSIIFNAFYNELKNNNNSLNWYKMNNIRKMNDIIKQIINKREKKIVMCKDDVEMEEEFTEIITLDKLPRILLGEIVSYLEFVERNQFEQISRSVFLDVRYSRNPVHHMTDKIFSKLLEFYEEKGEDYATIDDYDQLHIFNSLAMDVTKLCDDYFCLHDNVISLQIDFEDCYDLCNVLGHIRNSNLKAVRLDGYGYNIADMSYIDVIDEMQNLLTCRAPAVEYFAISGKFEADDYDFEFIGKLKGIAIYDYNYNENLNDSVYGAMGFHVNSLHVDWAITNEIEGKIQELKEFCTSWYLTEKEIDILMKQNMKNLERIYFKNSNHSLNGFTGNLAKNMPLLFEKILTTVQYVGFNLRERCFNERYTCPTIDLIHILSTSLKNKTKDKLKIRMDEIRMIKTDNEIFDMIRNLGELIAILDRNVRNWMVVISRWLISKNDKNDALPNSMKEQYVVNINGTPIKWEEVKILNTNDMMNEFLSCMSAKYNVKYNKNETVKFKKAYNEYDLVISNQHCNINGYHEHWIMECNQCEQKIFSSKN